MKSGLLITFILLSLLTEARPGLLKSFWKLSRPEKGWAMSHPFKARRAFLITQQVRLTTDSLIRLQLPDTFRHGGRIDAFRHSFWMALMTLEIGERASRKLGECHEKGNRIDYRRGRTEDGFLQDATACEMDLHNNEKGIQLALRHPDVSRTDLIRMCLESIRTGEMKVLLINSAGEYCDCEERPVVLFRRGMDKWALPICLISSR